MMAILWPIGTNRYPINFDKENYKNPTKEGQLLIYGKLQKTRNYEWENRWKIVKSLPNDSDYENGTKLDNGVIGFLL